MDDTTARQPSRIVVLDAQPDHALLIREALEKGLPGARVVVTDDPRNLPARAEVAVISLEMEPAPILAWLEAVRRRQQRPGVVFVSGRRDRWPRGSRERVPHAAQLSKADGAGFLAALPEAVRAAMPASGVAGAVTQEIETLPRPKGAPEAPVAVLELDGNARLIGSSPDAHRILGVPADSLCAGAEIDKLLQHTWPRLSDERWIASHAREGLSMRLVPLSGTARLLLASTRGQPETPQSHPLRQSPGRGQGAVLASLAGELSERLEHLDPITEMLEGRAPGDPVLARYASGLREELQRARAIASRIASIGGRRQGPAGRLVLRPEALVKLRLAAWRYLGPESVAYAVLDDSRSAPLRVDVAVLGAALDALVLAFAHALPDGGRVDFSTERVDVGPAFVARHPGVREGEHVRLRLIVEPGGQQAIEPPSRATLEAGIAAAKAHRGYLDSWREDRRLGVDIYLPCQAQVFGLSAGSRSVLVVDDEQPVREVLSGMLEAAGIFPVAVASGEEAIDLYAAGCRYDLVILDMAMGGIDGEATFGRLQELDPTVRVLLCSGSPGRESTQRMLARGLLGLVLKPFRMVQLLELVRFGLPPDRPAATTATGRVPGTQPGLR